MKKWLFLCAVCLIGLVTAAPIQDRRIDPDALAQLGATLGIPKDADLISETQKRWLRPASQERWEIAELSADQKQFVLQWAENQGMFAPWKPQCKDYDQALILGATTCRMQMRLDYLKQLWEEGVRFREIVWLTGDRPLDPRIDRLTDRCTTESKAAEIIWEETELPEEMRQCNCRFIAVPMQKERRPNTADTILAWLDGEPKPCTALFISDQPFCGYQFATIRALLPEPFSFDLAGQGVDPNSHPAAAAITLDSIARWAYTDACTR